MKTKICTRCKTEKPITEFHNDKNRRDGKSYNCKPCGIELVKAWAQTPAGKASAKKNKQGYRATERGREKSQQYNKRPDVKVKAAARAARRCRTVAGRCKSFDAELRRNYGIDVEDWARMYDAQDRKCASCGDAIDFSKTTHVDHCHRTGKVRGLVCQFCNIALGGAKDSVERLRALIRYLEARC